MDYVKYILVFVVFFVHVEAGGHEEKHHDHVKLHIPKFIHHDHHTKVITIHHHHHKPKKEHHHHHHHHHKPKAPQGHHYQHHHKKTSTHSVSKGHSSHGNHGSHGHHGHHGSHGPHGHHGHHGHGHEHKHHDTPLTYDPPTVNYQPPSYDSPTVNYEPPPINYSPSSSFGDGFGFLSSVPEIPGSPKIRGVVHTVKQTKVFDSLPNALPGSTSINLGNKGSNGYEVTEQEDEGEDDVYTAVNSLSQTYPSTYGFVQNAAAEENNDPFAEIPQQNSNLAPNLNAFQTASNPTSFANVNSFTSQSDPFQSSIPTQGIQQAEFPSGFEDSNSLTGQDPNSVVGFTSSEDLSQGSPLSFNREAGIQQSIQTGGVESLVY